MRIDLHAHSTASDGTLSPAGLVRAAADAGLDVLALTDHDTTRGWAAAVQALPPGLTLVRGAELSCRLPGEDGSPVSLHLLGYLFDPAEPVLRAERRRVRAGRLDRGRAMVQRLQAAGHQVSWEEVLRYAAGGAVGRPHIARALIAHGLVATVDEAFTAEWIGSRSRFWVAKEETDALEAVRMVRAAGGVPVFAHPLARRRGRTVGDAAVAAMAAAGLAGLEVDHDDHTGDERAHLRALARDLGLLVTGSSDFHGDSKDVRLGAHTTDPAVYRALVAQATGCEPVVA